MAIFGLGEPSGGEALGGDGLFEFPRLIPRLDGPQGRLFLGIIMVENGRPALRPDIRALPVHLGWVVVALSR